jgi:hypothetical protein
MPSYALPTREGKRTEAIRPEPQWRATDPCPGSRRCAGTHARSGLVEPLSRPFRDRTHRAAIRLDRAPSRCVRVRPVRVASPAALFQTCDRAGFLREDLGEPRSSASRCRGASWQVATAPHKRPVDRVLTSCRNSSRIRMDCASAEIMRTNHADVLVSSQLRAMCSLGLDKWMCVGDYRDSLVGPSPLFSSSAASELCAVVMVGSRQITALPTGAWTGEAVSRSTSPSWRAFR